MAIDEDIKTPDSKDAKPSSMNSISGKEMLIFTVVAAAAMSFLAFGGIAWNTPAKVEPEAAPLAPIAPQPKFEMFVAEDIVTFPISSIACTSKDSLGLSMGYALKHETTKMNAMFVESGVEGAECMMLSTNQKFKVISVEYNDPKTPEFGLLEIVGQNIRAANKGAWTLSMSAQKVSATKK